MVLSSALAFFSKARSMAASVAALILAAIARMALAALLMTSTSLSEAGVAWALSSWAASPSLLGSALVSIPSPPSGAAVEVVSV